MDRSLKKQAAALNLLGDEQLLAEFKSSGDFTALGILIARYQHLVFGYCLKHLRDKETARDIAMVVLERILQSAPHTQVRYFKSWLMTVLRHEIRDTQKRLQRRLQTYAPFDDERNIAAEEDGSYHMTDPFAVEKQEAALRKAIDGLREEQKTCLLLFYFEQKSYKEIAEITSFSPGEVKSLLQNGKRNLHKKLQSDPHFNHDR